MAVTITRLTDRTRNGWSKRQDVEHLHRGYLLMNNLKA